MTGFERYAIYYLPPAGPFADFTASWLGWDVLTGEERSHPKLPNLPRPVSEITATPRKYGFHGTLKPPFRLAEGAEAIGLRKTAETFAKRHKPLRTAGLRLKRIGRFLALCPPQSEDLTALAAGIVRDFDTFRAPTTEQDLIRRRKSGLNAAQEANLARWGYPYVMDEFRFHLTLTGQLTDRDADVTVAAVEPLVAPFLADEFEVNDICLVGSGADGCFRLIERFALGMN
ncbi:DUF1045 domain-containing protein [Qingshengfaniella alkalisoli]|uniref:DUF1045 domain-containing protein n=1 Tax=Qingshengfaniella alkalisoli TaxID=2599296 RepID=A0A5B8IAP4_9RHOB|nr:DUF1045 domain-containing protein [Qingshengfaniella alkalisoli]QDY71605.1 DUF1045 domain-containing protein [Qingshengfaniella alkalisoli]